MGDPAGAGPARRGERVEVVVRKPRLVCAEDSCERRTFTQAKEQLPRRARCLSRLREALLEAVIGSGRAVEEVADCFGVAWWTVQHTVNAAAVLLPDVDERHVRHLGIDEHRYRSVRFFRDTPEGPWRRVEPWMTTFVNAATGQVLGVVDGRDTAAVQAWLTARSSAWRAKVEVVAIDPSAAFRRAITAQLPGARVAVDPFHLVQLAGLVVTRVRQRLTRDTLGRRGRACDASWANRRLLLRGYDTLSEAARAKLNAIFERDDPTDELSAAWAVKEALRLQLKSDTLQTARQARTRFRLAVLAADMPETDRLCVTVEAWWEQIETYIDTRVTNARTEAANTTIKQIKRTGRGYRNPKHYKTRILLRSAGKRRRSPLTRQGTTLNCE